MAIVAAAGVAVANRSSVAKKIERDVVIALRVAINQGETRAAVLRALIRQVHDNAVAKYGQP